ncbi:hypothetical protein BABINDRAFT_160351 [Babjeviella inositovora NRRL Y-12698]|uniref:type I protein arginine methyltransferase n=1 Tax=Babjeviella inositovora NRRL Y-12698 TaxID=984486 RepID=A0A1E3QT67_9ASCO|nr:uncharacterized protein BABINDRAFT_160351 [Babjeviella inositovora NRRL Y-12698]ODQ80906.1 hypothetical protein BABINDRAFT_160351 [Babjeviella inositovora NRRL Y-12698]
MSTEQSQLTSATDKAALTSADQHYFTSYDHFGIHEEMLKDSVRTISYRNAILKNRHMFKDKVVLDVGCGTGILSMFAARAGAKHVIGVDMSSIIEMAEKVVKANGLDDKITLLRGKLEDVVLPYKEVDIIISEWMGYFLLYESMLDTVLIARDMYLAPGGLIFPDKASIHVAALEDGKYKQEKIHFWDDVYGFDYSCFKEVCMTEPLVDIVEDQALVTSSENIIEFDLNTVTIAELAFHRQFSVTAHRDDTVHAFIVWFDIVFPGGNDPDGYEVVFSTGPHAQYTHWKQTVFYLDNDISIKQGEVIKGSISSNPNAKNPRDLDVVIEWGLQTADQKRSEVGKGKLNYIMR